MFRLPSGTGSGPALHVLLSALSACSPAAHYILRQSIPQLLSASGAAARSEALAMLAAFTRAAVLVQQQESQQRAHLPLLQQEPLLAPYAATLLDAFCDACSSQQQQQQQLTAHALDAASTGLAELVAPAVGVLSEQDATRAAVCAAQAAAKVRWMSCLVYCSVSRSLLFVTSLFFSFLSLSVSLSVSIYMCN